MRISIRKILFIGLLVGGVAYGITSLRAPRGASDKQRMIQQLEKENEELQREIEIKRSYLTRMEKNPDELQLEIEKRLKLVQPGSKSFIIQEGDKPAGRQPEGKEGR